MFEIIVYQFIDSFKFGGGENVAFNYAMVLKSLNIENCIIAKSCDDKRFTDKCKYNNVNTELFSWFKNRKINKNDIFIIHTNRNLIKFSLNSLFNSNIKKENIFYVQHLNYSEKKFRVLSFFINFFVGNFIKITPVTDKQVERYIKSKVLFFPNFYINKYDSNDKNIRKKIRKELNVSDETYLICFSGIFRKGKNLEDYLKLSTEYKKENLKFLLLGSGPEEYLVKKYKNENLIWPGRVEDVEKYLLAADMYIFTSVNEMLPMALIEAVNSGLVCLGYDTVFNRFILEPELICGSFEELKEKAEFYCNNNIKRYSYSKRFDFNFAVNIFKKILGVE